MACAWLKCAILSDTNTDLVNRVEMRQNIGCCLIYHLFLYRSIRNHHLKYLLHHTTCIKYSLTKKLLCSCLVLYDNFVENKDVK